MKDLEQIKSKIITISDFERIIDSKEYKSQKIVFTNGCFDIIHAGHVAYLAEARSLGEILVIGLNTDRSVKRLKGENRPVNSEKARAIVLAAMQFVDFIILFDEDTPYNLINKIKPNVLVKGGDYRLSEIVGADIVLENGGIVKTITFVNGYSTTNILEKIKNEKS